MKEHVLAAMLALAVAGCTSPASGDLGNSPALPAMSPAPAAQVDALPPPAVDRSVADGSAGFPAPPPCASGEPGCGMPIKAHGCRTAGAVTTCDAPPDPDADRTLYTN